MHAVGGEALAWLGWLLALPISIATKAAGMDASAWAAWVQAVFSVIAIGVGFGSVVYQNRRTDQSEEAERERRAEVVAYRLSGWIVEIGGRIDLALQTCHAQLSKASQGPPRLVSDLIAELRLGMELGIEGVLPELHYLSSGSGDIAQLDYFTRFFDGWLDRTAITKPGQGPQMMAGPSLREFYEYAERQLTMMKTLHTDAARHIAALVEQAIKKGR